MAQVLSAYAKHLNQQDIPAGKKKSTARCTQPIC